MNRKELNTFGNQLKTPVLFLIFNRPDVSRIVFEQIKIAKPTKLYIACDGPRSTKVDEYKLVQETREWVIKNIDWNCEYFTLFREINLGCGKAVSSAINWFFENEAEGIILEDDCLPNQDFFFFCEKMLEYYRYNDKVAHICGCNLQNNIARGDSSYYYSNFTYVWGWAGWRRSWENYDFNLKLLDIAIKKDFLDVLTNSKTYKWFLEYVFKNIKKGLIDTWDFQYFFLNVFNNRLSIVPNNNMISNIGFNENATHTTENTVNASIPLQKLELPISHPKKMLVNYQADQYTLKQISPKPYDVILLIIKSYIKEVIKSMGKKQMINQNES